MGLVPDDGTGPVSSIEKNRAKEEAKNEAGRMRARMRRDARDGVACRYNKPIARRGYRQDDHRGYVDIWGRGEHAKGFQQA